MTQSYTPQQYNELFDSLPEELQNAVLSLKTSNAIIDACKQQDITDERVSQIGKYAGDVLMGILLPQDYEETLRANIQITRAQAKEIAQDINRFIFFPVRPALRQIYTQNLDLHETSKKPARDPQGHFMANPAQAKDTTSLPNISAKEDLYRETVDEN